MGRDIALRAAKDSADSKQQMPFSLAGHNCEAFAVLCWTGRWEECHNVTDWLQHLVPLPRVRHRSKLSVGLVGQDLSKWKRSFD